MLSIVLTALILGGLLWFVENAPPPVAAKPSAVRVVHMVKDASQRFVGEIKLPHSCYRLIKQEYIPSAEAKDTGDLVIDTQDLKLEERVCTFYSTAYYFDILAENDHPITITQMLIDGKSYPVEIQDRPWTSSRGTEVVDPFGTSPTSAP